MTCGKSKRLMVSRCCGEGEGGRDVPKVRPLAQDVANLPVERAGFVPRVGPLVLVLVLVLWKLAELRHGHELVFEFLQRHMSQAAFDPVLRSILASLARG